MTPADAAPERGEEMSAKAIETAFEAFRESTGDWPLDPFMEPDNVKRALAESIKAALPFLALPSPEAGGDNLGDLNFCKAYWRAPVANCLHLDCVADCNPATAHCGRFAEVCEEHNAKVKAPLAGGDVVRRQTIFDAVSTTLSADLAHVNAVTFDDVMAIANKITGKIEAALSRAQSKSEPTREEVVRANELLDKVSAVLAHRFPRCRDCADDGPTCPHSGLPCDLKSAFDAIRALYTPQAERREGWQLVPIEPTDAMVKAAAETRQMQIINGVLSLHQIRMGQDLMLGHDPNSSAISDAYRAMLAAAPPSPVAEGE